MSDPLLERWDELVAKLKAEPVTSVRTDTKKQAREKRYRQEARASKLADPAFAARSAAVMAGKEGCKDMTETEYKEHRQKMWRAAYQRRKAAGKR